MVAMIALFVLAWRRHGGEGQGACTQMQVQAANVQIIGDFVRRHQ